MEEKLTLLKTEDSFTQEAKVYLVGERIIGAPSKIRVVVKNKLTGKESVVNVKRKINAHARADRSKPRVHFWFLYGGEEHNCKIEP